MNRVIAMTAIHDGGECDAFYNGQRDRVVEAVKTEIKRMNEANAREMGALREEVKAAHARRDKLLAEESKRVRLALSRHCGLMHRALRWICDAWALAIGTVIVWGEALGLWVYEGSD